MTNYYVYTCYPLKVRTTKQIIEWMNNNGTPESFQTKKSANKHIKRFGGWIAKEPADKSVFDSCDK